MNSAFCEFFLAPKQSFADSGHFASARAASEVSLAQRQLDRCTDSSARLSLERVREGAGCHDTVYHHQSSVRVMRVAAPLFALEPERPTLKCQKFTGSEKLSRYPRLRYHQCVKRAFRLLSNHLVRVIMSQHCQLSAWQIRLDEQARLV